MPALAVTGAEEGAPDQDGLLAELRWRCLFQDATSGLAARLADKRPVRAYNGFDPTGPSLHVGHLIPVFGLMHLQRHGGVPVVVVGGGTGMIGDPSGRSAERNLLTREQVIANTASIQAQLSHFLDFSAGERSAIVVDNHDWLGQMRMLDFLRDVGKHFTIPYMLAKDSVQKRLGGGLSYTEFSYMLLQAADFLHLHREMGVELQTGGADQWGNITAGLELIRRVMGSGDGPDPAHGLSYPLLLSASGEKFGKTAAGTSVWLDPERTSPYDFYQFWMDVSDDDAARLTRMLTLLEQAAIDGLEAEARTAPEGRPLQRALARDITARVHGADAAQKVEEISAAVFGRRLATLGETTLEAAFAWLPHAVVTPSDVSEGAARLALAAGLFSSGGEARRTIAQGGLSINEVRVAAADASPGEPIAGRFLVLRSGKKNYRIVRIEQG